MYASYYICQHTPDCCYTFLDWVETPISHYTVDTCFWVFFTFYNCIVQMGFLPWESWVAFPGESQLRRSHYPTYGVCWVFWCFYNPPNSDMDYGIFNVRTDINASDCTRGCADTVPESVLKVDSWRKIPCRTRELDLRQWRDGPIL